jgi:drug/metabolite transporter (DMT)-like permease
VPRRAAPAVALVLVTAVWGVTFVQIKDALELYPLFAFLAVRFAIAVACSRSRAPAPAFARLRDGRIAGGALGALLARGTRSRRPGSSGRTVSAAGFVTGMYVVLTPVFGFVLFRSGPERRSGWASLSRSSGLAMLSGHLGRLGARDPAGARRPPRCARFRSRRWNASRPRYDPLAFTTVEMAASARRCSRWLLSRWGRSSSSAVRTVWGALLVTGVFASALGYLVQAWAQQRRARRRTALIFALEPSSRDLRLRARRRPPRRRGLGRLRGDPVRDRRRRAGCRGDACAARARAEKRLTAVLLALVSAALFGAMTVAVRIGFRYEATPACDLATVTWALAVALASALSPVRTTCSRMAVRARGVARAGGSQLFFTFAIRSVGASRTSVVVGARRSRRSRLLRPARRTVSRRSSSAPSPSSPAESR